MRKQKKEGIQFKSKAAVAFELGEPFYLIF